MNIETVNYIKKCRLLQQILMNYKKEGETVAKKDVQGFRKVLNERMSLLKSLNKIGPLEPTLPFSIIQHSYLVSIVAKIQEERGKLRKLFPG